MNPKNFSAPTADLMNELLPAFEFVSLIMSNADQAVYLANQKSLDRHVAIKVHSPDVSADEHFKEAFEEMARQMAKLNHVNLIGVYNSGMVDGMLYLVMEFVPGRPLQQVLKITSLEPAQVAGMIDGISSGLARAHQDGIVHGGLSPLNVLVTPEYVPKIGNFGFVSTASSDGEDVSSRYMAPELFHDAGGLSPLADVFSLGVLLYELYTGKPFVVGVVPPQLTGAAGRKVLEVIKKATSKDPAQRYLSVGEFQSACTAALPKSQPIAAAKQQAAAKSPRGPQLSAPPKVAAATPPPQVKKRNPLKTLVSVFLVIVFLVLALGGGAYFVKHRMERQKQEAIQELARQQELERQKQQKLEAEKAAALEEEKRKLEALQKQIDQRLQAEKQGQSETHDGEVKLESPYESLEELRGKLLAGDRAKMPNGSRKLGSSYFVLIDRAMTWPEASWFAESYGAHLAILGTEASPEWLRTQFGVHVSDGIWVGVARSGREAWASADGSICVQSGLPESGGDFVVLGKDGKLQGGKLEEKHPFVMQWHGDGSNPGALAKLLQQTQLSISSGNPTYPPGTFAIGLRNYLYVARPMDWESAAALAQSSGGHLLVLGGVAEAIKLDQVIAGLPVENRIWLGGRCRAGQWSWVSKEPWDAAKWRGTDVPKLQEAALAIDPGTGWKEQDPQQKASGFIIEWSADASRSVK